MTLIVDESVERRQTPCVSGQELVAGLRGVGLGSGDVVMAHSSLSSFGHVKGGAETVIDALLEVVGPKGTVVMPAFTWDAFHDKRGVVFDVANATVRLEVGIIPEAFRRRSAAIRSCHICHSVAAIGARAQDVMGEGVRSFGPGSTFDALYRLDAWILLLGVGFEACTALHMAEAYRRVPYRAYRDFHRSRVVMPDGRCVPSRSVEYLRRDGYQNDLAKMGDILARAGILCTGRIGAAEVTNVKLRDLFHVSMARLQENVGFLLTPDSQVLLEQELTQGLAVCEPWPPPRTTP